MSKISTYEVVPVPKLADKLIGTSVGGEIEDVTYNFTLQELLDLFIPLMPANNLQGILDFGNTATQDINLFGTITTTYLDVTDTANFLNSYFVGETHIQGGIFDSTESIGTAGQVLTSTGEFVEWVTLPPIFTPNLQQVLEVGNTADIDIVLDANIQALDVSSETANVTTQLTIQGVVMDYNESVGTAGQVLSSTSSTVEWVSLPVYSATSPLLFNSATGVFSIQVASGSQNGYLSSSDWITFNGKQNAGNYITALTGEATATGPGSVPITLNNAAVIGKVLTGFNPIAGTINASDSILTAFGKTQSQINALVGGVQYQGVWNASTNTPTLTSSVGVQGHYYVVNVAGNTNLNGITDWQIGDWAIFSESVWQKVDNTDSVTSVNGFTGAVSLTTDNIPEGTTNLYFLNSRARAAVSATSPLLYNNTTGVFSIQQASGIQNGYLSSTDWTTFNGKQDYLGGTGLVKSTAGTITYITDNSGNWNTAYNRSLTSAAVTGTGTKTLTLNQQDGGTITASWSDADTGLTSVGLSMPSAFTVSNSPLTSNGTIGVTGAGTTAQYVRGDGSLATFPSIISEAQNLVTEVYNSSGATLTKGTVVYINGGQGNLPTITKAIATSDATSAQTYGVVRSDITNMNNGYVVVAGRLGDLDTRDYTPGQQLYLSSTTAGAWTPTKQYAPNHLVYIAIVVRAHPTQGVVEVMIQNGYEMDELHNVAAQNPDNNDILQYKTSTSLWTKVAGTTTNIAEGTNLYYLDSRARAALSFTPGSGAYNSTTGVITIPTNTNQLTNGAAFITLGSLSASAPLSYNNTTGAFSISQSSSTTDGYLSSTDWNTFNNKQPAGSYVPTSRLLSINGTQYDLSADRSWSVGTVTSVAALTLGTTGTDLSSSVANGTTTPVITLNVPTASAANRGALSAADWSTFNTKIGSVTASSPLFSSGGSTPNLTIQQASGSQNGFLSSTDWTTFNNKQAAGNYITSLTGEATATGPGAASVTLNNAAVTGKVLTGVNITGGSISATDSILTAFGKVQNQINGLIGSTIYQGTWNASTNTPTLTSGVGVRGYYYIVSVAGNTNLDGITDWFVGDWAIFDGTAWQQVDNTDAVVSVNGFTGAVSLTTDNIPEGSTNQYYLNSRARAALSFAAGSGAYNSTTGVITIPTNNNQITNGANYITLASLSGSAPIVYNSGTGAISITQAGTACNGFLSSTDWNTFNNKTSCVGTVTSVAANAGSGISISGSPITTSGTFCITNTAPYSGEAVIVLGGGTCSSVRCGVANSTTGNYSAALGGYGNTASARYSGIVSGYVNTASGIYSFVGAGQTNTASGERSFVGGGLSNTASGLRSTVVGGASNCAVGPFDAVVGGFNNKNTSSCQSFIGGGCQNYITTGVWQTIAGGIGNCIVSGGYNFIGGGYFNTLCTSASESAIVVGGGNTVSNSYSAILSGHINVVSGRCSSLSGGKSNLVSGDLSFIGGGTSNTSSGTRSAVGGGISNISSGTCSFVGGGDSNTASGALSFIGAGQGNTASSVKTTISGGLNNTASHNYATVGGGICNRVLTDSYTSTISGGYSNIICAPSAFIGGGTCNFVCCSIANCASGATISGGAGNNTSGGTWLDAGYFSVAPTAFFAAGKFSTIGGGFQNQATACFTSIIGGCCNAALFCNSTAGGGASTASGRYSTAIGQNNTASGNGSVSIGQGNTSSGARAVSFGRINTASGNYSGSFSGIYNVAAGANSVIAGGQSNCITGACSAILGGLCNRILAGTYNAIGGGFKNCMTASANYNFIGGGQENCVTGSAGIGAIVSGYLNTSSGQYGFIGAGTLNNLTGRCSAIVAGKSNTASSVYTFVGGGISNTSSGNSSTVSGGCGNISSAAFAVIGGGISNISNGQAATVAGGRSSSASATYSTVGGGYNNFSTGYTSTVSGGYINCATGQEATISGGRGNLASGPWTTVGGGQANSATICRSTVGGGNGNNATAVWTTVAGGLGNNATGNRSFVGGGSANTSSGNYSVIGGGDGNIASNTYSTISGGYQNRATAGWDFIGGGDANCITSGLRNVISGGQQNRICAGSTGCNAIGGGWANCITTGFVNTVGGGYNNRIIGGSYHVIAGGYSNQISSATESGILTGGANTVSGNYSVVVGGQANSASGVCSFVGGGRTNAASGNHSTVAGGRNNTASGYRAAVAGGDSNSAVGNRTFIGAGTRNTASGNYNMVVGGVDNSTSSGSYSVLVGGRVNLVSGSCAFLGGGQSNIASGGFSFLGTGTNSCAPSAYGFLGNGCNNVATGCFHGTVVNGQGNSATANYNFVGNGLSNVASGTQFNIVVGGRNNTASGDFTFIGGGGFNTANSCYSSVIGGCCNSTNSAINAHIIGSCIPAVANNFTFVNSLCQWGGGISDGRRKNTIQDTGFGLDDIVKLRPVSYCWNGDKSCHKKYGFIAQEVQQAMACVVETNSISRVDENGLEVLDKNLGSPILQFEKDAIYASYVNAFKEIHDRLLKLENKS